MGDALLLMACNKLVLPWRTCHVVVEAALSNHGSPPSFRTNKEGLSRQLLLAPEESIQTSKSLDRAEAKTLAARVKLDQETLKYEQLNAERDQLAAQLRVSHDSALEAEWKQLRGRRIEGRQRVALSQDELEDAFYRAEMFREHQARARARAGLVERQAERLDSANTQSESVKAQLKTDN